MPWQILNGQTRTASFASFLFNPIGSFCVAIPTKIQRGEANEKTQKYRYNSRPVLLPDGLQRQSRSCNRGTIHASRVERSGGCRTVAFADGNADFNAISVPRAVAFADGVPFGSAFAVTDPVALADAGNAGQSGEREYTV